MKAKCANRTCRKAFTKKQRTQLYCSKRCSDAVYRRTRYEKYFKSQGEHGERYIRKAS